MPTTMRLRVGMPDGPYESRIRTAGTHLHAGHDVRLSVLLIGRSTEEDARTLIEATAVRLGKHGRPHPDGIFRHSGGRELLLVVKSKRPNRKPPKTDDPDELDTTPVGTGPRPPAPAAAEVTA